MADLPILDRIPVVCRPARPEDKPAVLQMTSRIWEGRDYIADVWDEWIAHREGKLAVAEAGGQVVGLGKLSKMGPGEWLLCGLRTDPDLEGRGIASQTFRYLVKIWEQAGDGILRVMTTSKRLPVIHLCEGEGFAVTAELTKFLAPALPGEANSFESVQTGEVEAALQFAQASPLFPLQYGLVNIDWTFVPPTLEILQAAALGGNGLWWNPEGDKAGRQGFASAFEEVTEREDTGRQRTLILQLAACSLESLGSYLVDFRRLAGARGCQYAHWLAGFFSEIQPHLHAAGFERAWDLSIYVFARLHPNSRPVEQVGKHPLSAAAGTEHNWNASPEAPIQEQFHG